jgi:pyruvate kinase
VYYPSAPPPAPRPAPTFDRAWNAVLGALHENGVRVASADFATGVIRGTKDRTDLFVSVARQANGTIQLEIEAKGPQGRDAGLASRISEAYQRRMGL